MRRDAGFTLIEALVGVALLGLVFTTLAAGTAYVLRVERVQTRLLARTSDLDGVERLLRRLIAQASPGGANTAPVHGTSDRLLFTTAMPEPGLPRDLYADAALLLSGGRLVLQWRPHIPGGTGGTMREAELLTGVAGLSVAYFSTGWRDRWDGPERPALIRVRVAFPAGDARHWPDLVIAPVRERPRSS